MYASFWHTLPMAEQREQAAPVAVAENDRNESGDPQEAGPRPPREIGGPKGPEPTRFGDWERGGRCIDF